MNEYPTIEPATVLLSLDRIGLAVAVIRDDGYPETQADKAEVFQGARDMVEKSFTRRGIPDLPGGWSVMALHPEHYWRPWLSPEIATQVDADLATRPPGAVVIVLFAVAML